MIIEGAPLAVLLSIEDFAARLACDLSNSWRNVAAWREASYRADFVASPAIVYELCALG